MQVQRYQISGVRVVPIKARECVSRNDTEGVRYAINTAAEVIMARIVV
jgi:hypothetical protein